MFRTWLIGCAAAAALAIAPAQALVFNLLVFNLQFDGTANATVTAPILGTGTFSFTGDPGNVAVPLTSLPDYSFDFTVNGVNFTTDDIVTPLANIMVSITTDFTNRFVNFGGTGGGPFGGSIDFIAVAGELSFLPGFAPLFFTPSTFGTYQGVAAVTNVVPEPMSLALFGLGLAGLAAATRRRA